MYENVITICLNFHLPIIRNQALLISSPRDIFPKPLGGICPECVICLIRGLLKSTCYHIYLDIYEYSNLSCPSFPTCNWFSIIFFYFLILVILQIFFSIQKWILTDKLTFAKSRPDNNFNTTRILAFNSKSQSRTRRDLPIFLTQSTSLLFWKEALPMD